MDDKRKEAAQRLLNAAHDFWRACQAEGQRGAVQWLQDSSGALLVFTRGEYRDQIMRNILEPRSQIHSFRGEAIAEDTPHD